MIILNRYETLLDTISEELPVLEIPLVSRGYEGNYLNGVIFVDSSLPSTRKREILSEEYAHYKTSVGTIINYKQASNRKQELQARRYATELIISLDDLIECHEHNLATIYECAEYLEVSSNTLRDALKHYQTKFGIKHQYKDKLFIFNDESLMILDKQNF